MPQVGELSVLFTGNDAKLTAVTAHAQRSLQRFAGFARGALAAAGVSLGLAGVAIQVRKAVQAASEQEDAERKLATALGRTSKALIEQASALQLTTKFTDDAIISAQARIASFVRDEDQIKKLTKATLDFAAAQGMDAASAGNLLAKTVGSQMNVLGRYGIKVEGASGSTERLNQVISGVAKLFGGQAAAAADTFSGRVEILKNRFGELYEQVGGKVIPIIEKFMDFIDARAPIEKMVIALKQMNEAGSDAERLVAQKQIVKIMEDEASAIANALINAESLNRSWFDILKPVRLSAESLAKIAEMEEAITEQKKKQADLEQKTAGTKIDQGRMQKTGEFTDKLSKGFTTAQTAAQKLFTTLATGFKEFLEGREDLLSKVRMFGVEGLDAAIENINQQRMELMKEAAKLGLLPGVSGQINDAAKKQIDKTTREANQAFEDRVGGFGGDEKQQNQQAIQDVIRERDSIIEEAKALGRLTDELRAQINARAERAAARAITPGKTPEMVGLADMFGRMQKSIFESGARDEALQLAQRQLKAAEDAAKVRDAIAKAGERAADGIGTLLTYMRNEQGVLN